MALARVFLLLSLPAIAFSCWNRPRPTPPTTPAPVTTATPQGNCKCGVAKAASTRQTRGRIVGGVDAGKNEFPWQVALSLRSSPGSFYCGGSLISSDTVLTAAHCASSRSRPYIFIGDHDKSKSDGEKVIRAKSVTRHPKYIRNSQDYDYAIIKLSEPVTFNNNVYPVCLPSGTEHSNKDSIATGWGTLKAGGRTPDILQKVSVRTLTKAKCTDSSTIISSSSITDRMICAASPGKDACQGDSGGPLVIKNSQNFFELVGITSWGFGCANARAPGVYAKVSAEVSWIKGQTSGTTCPTP